MDVLQRSLHAQGSASGYFPEGSAGLNLSERNLIVI